MYSRTWVDLFCVFRISPPWRVQSSLEVDTKTQTAHLIHHGRGRAVVEYRSPNVVIVA